MPEDPNKSSTTLPPLTIDSDDDNDGIPDNVEAPPGQPQISDPKDPASRPPPKWYVDARPVPPSGAVGSTPIRDGSKALPFVTIQAAIDAASAASYEIIEVAAGSYAGNIHFNGKLIQVRSERLRQGPEVTFINGDASNPAVTFDGGETPSVCLVGFTIRDAAAGGIKCLNNSQPLIVDCVITNCGTTAGVNGGGIYCHNSSPTILNCKVLNSGNDSGLGGGIYSAGNSAPKVSHCTFSGNLRSTGGGQIHACDTAKVTLNNCVVWSSLTDAEIVKAGSATLTADFCDVRGGYNGVFNLNANPLLEPSGRLIRNGAQISPCIDRVVTNGPSGYAWLSRFDQDGEARLQVQPANMLFSADIGSDEYVCRLAFPLDANGFSHVNEASGVAYLGTVGGRARFAVVDNDIEDALLIYQLDATGSTIETTIPVNIRHPTMSGNGVSNNEIHDLEGITYDSANHQLYIVTSQTKRNRYRDVEDLATDPLPDPPSNDYDRRRTILERIDLDATTLNPTPSTNDPTRTVWESANQIVPCNAGYDDNHGLAAFISHHLDTVGFPYRDIDLGDNVLIAWNTENKFGIPQNGQTYVAGAELPYGGGGPSPTAGRVLGLTPEEIAAGEKTLANWASPNTWYYFRIWARDANNNYSDGYQTSQSTNLTDDIRDLRVNEYRAQAPVSDEVELYNPYLLDFDLDGIRIWDGDPTTQPFRFDAGTIINRRNVRNFVEDSGFFTFGWANNGSENIILLMPEPDNRRLDDWNMRNPNDDSTEGRAWDGGPRGFVSLAVDFAACFFATITPGSPYPPNLGALNRETAQKYFEVAARPDRATIDLAWANIGLIPAVWRFSPNHHDRHPLIVEGIAYRSPTEMIIGLRSPLSIDRRTGNALYFRVTDVSQFLPVGAWPAWSAMAGITGPQELNLGGQGIRSIEWCPALGPGEAGRYLIVGGPATGSGSGTILSLYAWDGTPGWNNVNTPQRLIADLRPYTVETEGVALVQINGEWRVMFVEDRGQDPGYGTRNAVHWPLSILGVVH